MTTQNKDCGGKGLCYDLDANSLEFYQLYKCESKCKLLNCDTKGCTEKAPQWFKEVYKGKCESCVIRSLPGFKMDT